jgi:uncharacterized membrane protein
MYESLVLLHVLAGFAWVGGGFMLVLGARTIRRASGPAAVDEMLARMEKAANYVFSVTPVLVIATGVTMVLASDAWSFSQTWAYLAISLFVVAAVLGGASDRMEKRIKTAREQGSVASEAIDRYLNLGVLEMVVLIGIIALMVYRPI